MKLVLMILATMTLAAGMTGERPSGRDTRTTHRMEA